MRQIWHLSDSGSFFFYPFALVDTHTHPHKLPKSLTNTTGVNPYLFLQRGGRLINKLSVAWHVGPSIDHANFGIHPIYLLLGFGQPWAAQNNSSLDSMVLGHMEIFQISNPLLYLLYIHRFSCFQVGHSRTKPMIIMIIIVFHAKPSKDLQSYFLHHCFSRVYCNQPSINVIIQGVDMKLVLLGH